MSFDHVGLHVTDIEKSRQFYLTALKPLGYRVITDLYDGKLLGLGTRCGSNFWLSSIELEREDGKKPKASGNVHIAFKACNRHQVREFYEAGLAAGGSSNGAPGLRPQYCSTYYGAYVLDPEGRNIEVVCTKPEILAEPWGYVGWGTTVVLGGGTIGLFGKYMGWF